jgi:histidinol-phosphate phosphatase family protein
MVVTTRPEDASGRARIASATGSGLDAGGSHAPRRNPGTARNAGWRAATTTWVAFVDHADRAPASAVTEVCADLARRLAGAGTEIAGLIAGCGHSVYRRSALAEVCGYDERFLGAERAEQDLALRISDRGRRVLAYPPTVGSPEAPEDDVLMRRLHGPRWSARTAATHGNPSARSAGATVGESAGPAAHGRARRPPALTVVLVALRSAARRLVATWRYRHAPAWPDVAAILFDRDGTLVHDVPYNGDPSAVRTVPGAARALRRLRRRRIRVGVVTNQSGVARGLLIPEQVAAVNATVDALLGPFDTWQVCPHSEADGCPCRKPQPGLVLAAARKIGVSPQRCVVIGDTGGDVLAALRAGARAVLVPTPATRPEEVATAPVVASDLESAVELALAGAV